MATCSICGKKIRWWQKVDVDFSVKDRLSLTHQKCRPVSDSAGSGWTMFRGTDYGYNQAPCLLVPIPPGHTKEGGPEGPPPTNPAA